MEAPASGDGLTSADAPVAASTRPSRRRAIVAWSAGITALFVLGAVIAFVHISANTSFDTAGARLAIAAEAAATAADTFQDAADAVTRSLVSAEDIVAEADDTLVDAKARSAFSKAIAAASETSEEVASLLDRGVDGGEFDKPFWTWELWSETASLEVRTVAADDFAVELAVADDALVAGGDAMTKAALALYASVPDKARAFEDANISARATSVLDFRESAAQVAKLTRVDSAAAVGFSALATRADLLGASSNAELAEKAGPLYWTRIEIEAYARSISGGIVLDFDWAPVVNEMSGYWGIGGLANWTTDRGGYTTITLSNSVAEWWTSDSERSADARALVTHEVGHAISGKCYDKFDWESADANEEWATAWAISMGHTADGNGVQAYGYPSQAMIDAAATCR
ncbi:hypothetical protein [Microbacterium sp. CFBP9034]|uniref:hypothetical protein n=1 Tax=Microbacterium sp. CFBP9034 TaxID=3096540 RepID=UPI002A6ACEEE|nr:hypothetical protein [Microbacterium sp. CFBP9034]MDY0910475.1 hypothetical protein [Microbacterium sp. CFBP9034]